MSMPALSKKHITILLIAALAAGLGVVLMIDSGRAGAQSEATAPTTEMTPAAAQALVVARFGREDGGVLGELKVTTVRSDLAEVNAVLEGQPASDAVYGGPPAIAEWRASPVYLVVMQAPAGSVFAPNVSTPPGHAGPTGSVMSVIVNAYTGQKEGLTLEPLPPSHSTILEPSCRRRSPRWERQARAGLRLAQRETLQAAYWCTAARHQAGEFS